MSEETEETEETKPKRSTKSKKKEPAPSLKDVPRELWHLPPGTRLRMKGGFTASIAESKGGLPTKIDYRDPKTGERKRGMKFNLKDYVGLK